MFTELILCSVAYVQLVIARNASVTWQSHTAFKFFLLTVYNFPLQNVYLVLTYEFLVILCTFPNEAAM